MLTAVLSRTLLAAFWLALSFCLPLAAECQGQTIDDPDEPIRIATELVDLHVSILSRDPARPAGRLSQKDFALFENGASQDIVFFSAAETPFDLVLLLDLSGSTSSKLDLIRKSAKRFVAAAPAADRVAIVTFTDKPLVVAPLTLDRSALIKAIDQIEKPEGGTNFWDALRFVLESVLEERPQSPRRSAVVAMTDGIDNALPDVAGEGSQITFTHLIHVMRNSEAIVLPIFLDTEEVEVKRRRVPASAYEIARGQLAAIADESGNIVYRAAELKDLEKVYQQLISELGTVYSLGYRPIDRARDGAWRQISVHVPAYPYLTVRARRGYFAK